ncbi:hypothetical protein CLLI_13380 [Clostridium liquoris]|jgi:uncharacterized protein YlxW (UPF0749 family)|uniref:Division initiation protein n=1 Tax=Clostridium liquoris TaxID=1289519 RepID=A0A2T0B4D9_9CLOT|nr:DUF881 domain-containing protein [Clostridium liquoris]PRR78756.1 hypothetical protein CLLI_13380 [Clostridium liquoris]
MRNNEANVFVFIASIIIGILIAMNISFTRENKTMFLSSKQYQDAYSYRNELLNDISNLSDEYTKYSNKLHKYENNAKNKKKIIEEINSEIMDNKKIIGYTDLQGPGIKITLQDASMEFVQDPFEYELRLIHNTDMIQVINDLLNAGAEAISINGLRVVSSTGVYCNGAFLRINGIQVCAPFYVNAIGNKDTLKNYMLADENHLKSLMLRNIIVDVEEDDNIKIPAFSGDIENKYIKSENK